MTISKTVQGSIVTSATPGLSPTTVPDVALNNGSITQLYTGTVTSIQGVMIQAHKSNTGIIRVGDLNVGASQGAMLSAGDSISFPVTVPTSLYAYASTSGQIAIVVIS